MQTKNYTTVFYFVWHFGGLDFKCKNLEVSFQAPEHLYPHEANEKAIKVIKESFKEFFQYDNFEIHIIKTE